MLLPLPQVYSWAKIFTIQHKNHNFFVWFWEFVRTAMCETRKTLQMWSCSSTFDVQIEKRKIKHNEGILTRHIHNKLLSMETIFHNFLTAARTLVVADTNFAVGHPERDPRALQASECHELLNPTRTSCLILAQRQPGKLSVSSDSFWYRFLLIVPYYFFADKTHLIETTLKKQS